jgi:2-hydroxy-6-oxonona-2,4-dienedioate hydrolase
MKNGLFPCPVQNIEDGIRLDSLSIKREIEVSGVKIVWREWGSGPSLVLLHGGSGSWNHWVKNIAFLVEHGMRVIIPDLPGFGESGSPIKTFKDYADADDLPELLDLALTRIIDNKPYQLVGFSFGSLVAAMMASQYPKNVLKLILVGGAGLGIVPKKKFIIKNWIAEDSLENRRATAIFNIKQLLLSNSESIDELAIDIHCKNLDQDRMKKRCLAKTDIVKISLKSVVCPVYGIWGNQDVLCATQFDQVEEALRQASSFRDLKIIENAGHWVQYENAHDFNQKMLACLDDQI